MAASGSVFAGRPRTGSRLPAQLDADGNEAEFDVREDEEQDVKLGQTLDLLLAAGYFRARIKGLSPFDKVVGGMTWCITTCNFDVDVDLLFQENSTIGQKIALTEKIVAVLPKMKCPHRIEPHQIQGLDFIHIYPVVQWLVKRAVETKEEMGDYIRAFSVSQFNKNHKTPEDVSFELLIEKSTDSVASVKENYKPQRRYRRPDAENLKDEETRVHSTLLEYGRRYGISKSDQEEKESEKSAKKRAVAAGLGGETTEEDLQAQEEKRIAMLMSRMSAMGVQEQSEIEQIEKTERVGGEQQHKRVKAAMSKQIEQQKSKLDEITSKHDQLHQAYLETQAMYKEAESRGARIDEEMDKLNEIETEENQSILQTLRSLVAMNENLKKQEQEFKAHCKEEMSRLKGQIEEVKEQTSEEDSGDKERVSLIDKQYEADREKLHKIRLLLARKTREIAVLQRKIDEVPSRAELSQYQRRFIELYSQISSTHKETKQFYTLYNTLDDTKLYLHKEVNLLNSVHDTFSQAMGSQGTKEQFLKQFEQIVEGIKQNKAKVEKRKQEEKMKRDRLNDQHLDLIEKQRLYFKTVKEFKEECRKNEILMSKLKR
ncbi:coiled-coil domain-containing protein 93-like isoform X2 [Mytilus californianus]|uniref:coiled-coil domain-containing protein 93-like isoform X2 n=1 Tax=Mytilus californianus TaxID=6549 RepID=UPI0022453EF4|nr:coiled-coil domain-containing protein 93-like isoform X2 [Mytilus californianus]